MWYSTKKTGTLIHTSLRMALPSLVMLIPPIGSRIIFNMEEGPRTEERMEAIAVAAWIFDRAVLKKKKDKVHIRIRLLKSEANHCAS